MDWTDSTVILALALVSSNVVLAGVVVVMGRLLSRREDTIERLARVRATLELAKEQDSIPVRAALAAIREQIRERQPEEDEPDDTGPSSEIEAGPVGLTITRSIG